MHRTGIEGSLFWVLTAVVGASCNTSSGVESAGSGGKQGGAGGMGGAGARDGGGTEDPDGASGLDGPGGDGPPSVSDPMFGRFCAAGREALVGMFDRCRGVAPEVARLLVNKDPCLWWGAAVAGERMVFDAASADACIAALGTLPCDADSLPAICDRALGGQLKPGDRCSMVSQLLLFSECETGTICVAGPNACEGKCVKRGLLNESCGADKPCVASETCDLNGRCKLQADQGAACGAYGGRCKDGLYCTSLIQNGTCMKRLGLGAGCSEDDQCEPPARCDRGLALTGTCKIPARAGAACVPDDFSFTCELGLLHCGPDMKCQTQPGLGQPCGMKDNDLVLCTVGRCDTNKPNPVCEKIAAGDSCTADPDCGPDALCALQNFTLVCTATCKPW